MWALVGAATVFILGALANAFFGEAVKRGWDRVTGRPGPEMITLSPPQTVLIESLNIELELESLDNYNPATGATRLLFSFPLNPLVKLTPANRGDRAVVGRAEYWFSAVRPENIGLGLVGTYEVRLKDHRLSPDGKKIIHVTVLIQKVDET